MKFDAESVAPGSRSRLNIGLIAAAPLILLAILLPGPGVWIWMALGYHFESRCIEDSPR